MRLRCVLPAVIVADALVGRRLRAALREHVALVAIYALGAVCALALFVTGHALLGTYSQTASGNPLPRADPRVGAGARRVSSRSRAA